MNIQNLADIYNEMPYPEQRKALAGIRTEEELDELLEMAEKGRRVAVRIFADLGKRAAKYVVAHKDAFLRLLKSDDPKKRANVARLLGDVDAELFLDDLIQGLEAEQTMFALPSYLLSIGKAKNEKARQFLDAYEIRSQLDKHQMEEKDALRRARANFVARQTPKVRILPSDIIACSTPNVDVTLRALVQAGFKAKKYGRYAVVSGVQKFSSIYRVRAYNTAYIYLGSSPLDRLPAFLQARQDAIIQRTQVTGYRMEVDCGTHQQRTQIIQQCVNALDRLQNAPSSYSMEIRVDVEGDKADVLLNPLTDRRFAYRTESVAASMGCATAACVCAYASRHFSPGATVLDDFCGAGTLLFERGFYPFHSLTGVDLSAAAIEAAEANSRDARVHPQFIHMNALRFTSRRYSEILCNMPFGMRVGSHEENKKLYDEYFRILPQITTQGALIVLFTHEKKLTRDLMDKAEHLELVESTTFDAGGLYPAAFVMRRDDSSYVLDRTDLLGGVSK